MQDSTTHFESTLSVSYRIKHMLTIRPTIGIYSSEMKTKDTHGHECLIIITNRWGKENNAHQVLNRQTDDDAPVIEQVPAWTSRDSHNSTDASQKVHAKLKEPDAGGYIGMISVIGCSEKGEIIGREIRRVLIRGWERGGD